MNQKQSPKLDYKPRKNGKNHSFHGQLPPPARQEYIQTLLQAGKVGGQVRTTNQEMTTNRDPLPATLTCRKLERMLAVFRNRRQRISLQRMSRMEAVRRTTGRLNRAPKR